MERHLGLGAMIIVAASSTRMQNYNVKLNITYCVLRITYYVQDDTLYAIRNTQYAIRDTCMWPKR